MKRKIIEIDEEKCNGCGLCIDACHERALELVDGKAKLISEQYCDGLGDCLPECPTGAITIVERKAEPFNEELVQQRIAEAAGCEESSSQESDAPMCPATRMHKLSETSAPTVSGSELRQWPIQMRLVNPQADYFKNADLLIAADCTAFAYGAFHKDFMEGKTTVIMCPKLDDSEQYTSKLANIIQANDIKSVTVARMEVPCCSMLTHTMKRIMAELEQDIPFREVVLTCDGDIAFS